MQMSQRPTEQLLNLQQPKQSMILSALPSLSEPHDRTYPKGPKYLHPGMWGLYITNYGYDLEMYPQYIST